MSTEERIHRIEVNKTMLKDIIADTERTVGMQAALPVTIPATAAIDAADTLIAALCDRQGRPRQ